MGFRVLDACTLYDVDLLKVNSETYEEISMEFNLDADHTTLNMSLVDIERYKIPENAIDYDSFDFDECMLESLLEEIIGKYPHYLVIALGCKWNGASGYTFCDDITKTVARDYDISLSIEREGNGAIECLESSHDVPTGSTTYIVGLDEDEYNDLNVDDIEIEELVDFAKRKF